MQNETAFTMKNKTSFKSRDKGKRTMNICESTINRWKESRENDSVVESSRALQRSVDHSYSCSDTSITVQTQQSDTGRPLTAALEVPDLEHVTQEETVVGYENVFEDQDWYRKYIGRRIVDIEVLASGLAHCEQCSLPLSLEQVVKETKQGLGGILYIVCLNQVCCKINKVPLGKRHQSVGKSKIWDINSKVATGMIHAGIGERKLNNLLTTMNLPTLQQRTLKKREREVGAAIEQIAKKSVAEAFTKEVEECAKSDESNGPAAVTASVDAAWQRRGSGRAYNSLSGHATMIGTKTGKVIGYQTRIKSCRVCQFAKKKGIKPKAHSCRKNWDGSSKAMEADMITSMIRESMKPNAQIKTIVGDEDSATIAKVRREVDETVEKKSDSNHLKKILGNDLYGIKAAEKLSTKTIKYIQKSFNYMCKQNEGNAEGIKEGLDAMAKHPFGDHTSCDRKWCRHIDDPSSKFSSLPYGRALKAGSLQQKLVLIFEKYQKQADKLASLQSTQSNENFNSIVTSKTSKSNHHSGSESLDFRVSAAAAQKNQGYSYVVAVNEKLGLSPGISTQEYSKKIDAIIKRKNEKAQDKTAKRRRLQLKSERHTTTAIKEVREGETYSTSTGLDPDTQDLEEIPGPLPIPLVEPVANMPTQQIVFDLETTGLGRDSHIVQIAATTSNQSFNTYVVPKRSIAPEASAVTHIECRAGQVFYEGKPVPAVKIRNALEEFKTFVGSEPALLIGHNIKSFDCHVLLNAAKSCAVNLDDTIYGFLDTLPIFRSKFPELKSHKQECVFQHCFPGASYAAHDALGDVLALKKLITHASPDNEANRKYTFNSKYIMAVQQQARTRKANLPSWNPLISGQFISKSMAEKAAASGLLLRHVELANTRRGSDGVEAVFVEKGADGKPRVTACRRIIDSVVKYMTERN